MDKISIQYFKSSLGNLIVGTYEKQLCILDWQYRKMRNSIDQRIQKALNATYQEESNSIIENTKMQIDEYISGNRKEFDIPLLCIGTAFQKKVWKELLKIPFGKTESYLSLSQKLGDEKAIRAVASANGANAISIIVPCHRIIGSNGELRGYAGGLQVKKKLLNLEKSLPNKEQLRLF